MAAINGGRQRRVVSARCATCHSNFGSCGGYNIIYIIAACVCCATCSGGAVLQVATETKYHGGLLTLYTAIPASVNEKKSPVFRWSFRGSHDFKKTAAAGTKQKPALLRSSPPPPNIIKYRNKYYTCIVY